jgi:predicted nucleic acid-binding protein
MESRGAPAGDIRKFFTSLLFYKGLQLYNLDLKGRIVATEKMDKEKKLDFDDATSIAVMKRLKINEIVSFNRDFDQVQGITRIEPRDAIDRS